MNRHCIQFLPTHPDSALQAWGDGVAACRLATPTITKRHIECRALKRERTMQRLLASKAFNAALIIVLTTLILAAVPVAMTGYGKWVAMEEDRRV